MVRSTRQLLQAQTRSKQKPRQRPFALGHLELYQVNKTIENEMLQFI